MDWKTLIAEIRATDMKQDEIGRAVGVSQASISDLANGNIKEPKFSLGQALVSLHRKRCKKARKAEAGSAA